MSDFYVYAYIRHKDSKTGPVGTPYYIGKGRRWRAWSKYDHKRHRIPVPADEYVVMMATNLSEDDAVKKEIQLIEQYGRKQDGGILLNRTIGGEGLSGHRHTERAKKAIGEKNRVNLLGRKHSEETKHKRGLAMSKALKGKPLTSKQVFALSLTWEVTYPSGETKIVRNLNDFCRENGLRNSNLRHVADGKRAHHHGFKAKRLSPPRKKRNSNLRKSA